VNKGELLDCFRAIPEKECGGWRYRAFGNSEQPLLLLPGGELVDDLGFEFGLAISEDHRVIYPAYPRASSMEELTDGLIAILDAESIGQVDILGASFGGAVAQVFVRRHPDRTRNLVLSNTGVPMPSLAFPVSVTYRIAKALPWRLTAKLLRKLLLKTLACSNADREFWAGYLDELFSVRLSLADILSNMLNQRDYHRRFHFTQEDLKNWHGRVLLAESDTDVIGPRRRAALRDTYPSAKVHTFHNAGHAPMFTRFNEYLGMIRDFAGAARGLAHSV
jgi:pimeloyl-ACP methyl ester carboxylesterase